MFVCAWISLSLSSSAAWADDAAAQAAAREKEAAAAAYERALALYEQGDLQQALLSMEESYRLSGHAELLYNMARLEQELGNCSAALRHYREYIQQVPDGRYLGAAEQASQELSRRCSEPATESAALTPAAAQQQPAAAPATTTAPSAPPPPDRVTASSWSVPRWVGWTALASGALAGAGAVYFTAAALDAKDRFQRDIDRAVESDGEADLSLQADQHRNQRLATAFAVGGGALLVGGAALLLFAPSPSTSSRASVYVQPGLIGAQFSQRF